MYPRKITEAEFWLTLHPVSGYVVPDGRSNHGIHVCMALLHILCLYTFEYLMYGIQWHFNNDVVFSGLKLFFNIQCLTETTSSRFKFMAGNIGLALCIATRQRVALFAFIVLFYFSTCRCVRDLDSCYHRGSPRSREIVQCLRSHSALPRHC